MGDCPESQRQKAARGTTAKCFRGKWAWKGHVLLAEACWTLEKVDSREPGWRTLLLQEPTESRFHPTPDW